MWKFGSFAFAFGLACALAAKANVPNVVWFKIVFKKCVWAKFKLFCLGCRSAVSSCRKIVPLVWLFDRKFFSSSWWQVATEMSTENCRFLPLPLTVCGFKKLGISKPHLSAPTKVNLKILNKISGSK